MTTFFKNLSIYRLPPAWTMTPGDLEAALARMPVSDPQGQSLSARGWACLGDGSHVYGLDHMMIALGKAEKVLPAAVVKQEVEVRAIGLEQLRGYKPGRKALREIKDQVVTDMLPRAFVRRSVLRAWIDVAGGFLIVDTPSAARADELVEVLRASLNGELAVTLVEPAQRPATLMTAWINARQAPGALVLGDECQLVGSDEDKPTVRYTRHPLEGDDVRRHIAEGKVAQSLALDWKERVSFVLTDKLQLKKVRFIGIREEKVDDPAEAFAQDFGLMTTMLSAMLADLVDAVGAGVRS